MKKTLTLLLLLVASSSFAQLDWSIKSIKAPTELESTTSGTDLNLILECENVGTDTVFAGDTLAFNMFLLDIATSNLLLQYPANAASGNLALTLVTENVAPGATYDLSSDLTTALIVRNSREVRLGFNAYVFSRTNPLVDVDSSNNSTFTDITWWNQYRDGVSVNEVNYNDNISVWPNPANNELSVEVLQASVNDTKIELVDLTGKVVLSKVVSDIMQEGAFKLDVSSINNGLYIVKITSGEETSTTKVSIAH